MKSLQLAVATFGLLLASTAAYAGFHPTLHNDDSKEYKYELDCGSSSTLSHINSNTTETLSSGCTLKVEGVGSAKLTDDMKCVIKNASLSCSK
jgi:hypothetical protein